MTYVSITENKILVEGHANYSTMGNDIVCASVSILCYTLLEYGYSLHLNGELTTFDATDNPGDVKIYVEGDSDKWRTALEVFETGIKSLSETYPDYVCLKVGMD